MTQGNYDPESVGKIISRLLDDIRKHYIKDASMLPIILSRDKRQVERLKILDGLYQSVLTSLQFAQYRRAVWYLQAFYVLCDQTFNEKYRDRIIKSLEKRILKEW